MCPLPGVFNVSYIPGSHYRVVFFAESFPAYLQPSAKLNISGECSLKVTSENIVAYDESSSNSLLVSWPIRALRRFGFDASRFTFEAGRYVA